MGSTGKIQRVFGQKCFTKRLSILLSGVQERGFRLQGCPSEELSGRHARLPGNVISSNSHGTVISSNSHGTVISSNSHGSNPLLSKHVSGGQHGIHSDEQRWLSALTPNESGSKAQYRGSVDEGEIQRFAAKAASWWDTANGPFALLHAMNEPRCSFIRGHLSKHYGRNLNDPAALSGLTILDIGCGGGLLCEPLARMGATVTGVDAAAESIVIAQEHAVSDPATSGITYRCATAEALVAEGQQFDVVTCLEVIEHVQDPASLCASLVALTKPGGAIFVSTINRTIQSAAFAVGAAEYVLGIVPPGTHDWLKFVTPSEMKSHLDQSHAKVVDVSGLFYGPLSRTWRLCEDTSINYVVYARTLPKKV